MMKKRLTAILLAAASLIACLIATAGFALAADESIGATYIDKLNSYVTQEGGAMYAAFDFSKGFASSNSGDGVYTGASPARYMHTYGNININYTGVASTPNKIAEISDDGQGKFNYQTDASTTQVYYSLYSVPKPEDNGNIALEFKFTPSVYPSKNVNNFLYYRFSAQDSTTSASATQTFSPIKYVSTSDADGNTVFAIRTSIGNKTVCYTELGMTYYLAFSIDPLNNEIYCFVNGEFVVKDTAMPDEVHTAYTEHIWDLFYQIRLFYDSKQSAGEFLVDDLAVYSVPVSQVSAADLPYCAWIKSITYNPPSREELIAAVGYENVIFDSGFDGITTPAKIAAADSADDVAYGYIHNGGKQSYINSNQTAGQERFLSSVGNYYMNSYGNSSYKTARLDFCNRGYQSANTTSGNTVSPKGDFVMQFAIKYIRGTGNQKISVWGTNDDGYTRISEEIMCIDKDGNMIVQNGAEYIGTLSPDRYVTIAFYVMPNSRSYRVYVDGEVKNLCTFGKVNEDFRFWFARIGDVSAGTEHEMYIDNVRAYYTNNSVGYHGEVKRADDGSSFVPNEIYKLESPLSAVPHTFTARVKLDADAHASVPQGTIIGGYPLGNTVDLRIGKNFIPALYWNTDAPFFTFDEVSVPVGEFFTITVTVDIAAATAQCYINGELKQSVTEKRAVKYPNDKVRLDKLAIGGNFTENNDEYFKGEIKEIALYSDIRTDEEILSDVANITMGDDGMIAHYKPVQNEKVFKNLLGTGGDALRAPLEIFWLEKSDIPEIKNDYTIAIVGDTQTMTQYHTDSLNAMYRWLADNAVSEKIVFAAGVGDIVNTYPAAGTESSEQSLKEWAAAKEAVSLLNGKVPYSLVVGNHDYPSGTSRDLTQFNTSFPLSELASANPDTYGGSFLENASENTYHTFEVENNKYMIFALEYGPRDEVLAWAGDVIASHPEYNVIITTHSYMHWDGTTADDDDYLDAKEKNSDANNGQEMWDKLVSKYENIVLVVSGHMTQSDIIWRGDNGEHGNRVTQILCDPQGMDDAAMLMLLRFSEGGKRVNVEWYSTTRDQYYRAENQFSFDVYERFEELYGNSITLGGEIGVNFYMSLDDSVLSDEGAYMLFTLANGKTQSVCLRDANAREINGEMHYGFTCLVNALEMSEEITAHLITERGNGYTYTYSVAKYAERIIAAGTESTEVISLIKAMVNYGAAAQTHFGYNTDALANAMLDESERAVEGLDGVDLTLYAKMESGGVTGLEYYGTSTILESNTVIRHYFTLADKEDISSYEFTVGGKSFTPIANDGMYYVDISDIAAPNLSFMYELRVERGGEEYTLNYSVYTYIISMLSNELSAETVLETVRAAYHYSQAAIAYLESLN